jgi:hypothetical protein
MRLDRQLLPGLLLAGGLAALLGGTALAQAKLYKWVDDNGVTHYSDRPQPGAKKVDVPAAQSFPAARTPPSAPAPRAAAPGHDAAADSPYSNVQILRPGNDEAFVNAGYVVDVAAALEPPLAPGHRTWFVLDGQQLQDPAPDATSATLTVERGSHTLQFQVADESGRIVASSAPVTFHVRQTSVAVPPRGPALQKPKKP